MGEEKPIFLKKKRKFSLFRLSVFILIIFFLVGIACVIASALMESKKPTEKQVWNTIPNPLNPGEKAFKYKDDLIILCIGLDENRDQKGILHHKGSRTDTIFLLHIDKNASRLGMLNIPRDTYVKISDKYGFNKINSAYSLAFMDEYEKTNCNYEKSREAGILQAKETIENFLGINIDYTVLIEIKAVVELIDAIGGLTLDVEKDMDYDDNWGNLHIHLKKGRQKLNGKEVVGYARFRHDEEGDWGRIRRQQQVVNALVRELKYAHNIMRIDKIADVIMKNVKTDIPPGILLDIAQVYKSFDRDNIVKGVITGEDGVVGDAAVIYPDEAEKERLVARLLKDPGTLKKSDIRVQVLNNCGTPSIARNLAKKLETKGYKVIDVADATEEADKLDETSIADYYRNQIGLGNLENDIGKKNTKELKKRKDNELKLDYTIILGKDYGQVNLENSEADKMPSSPEPSPTSEKMANPTSADPDISDKDSSL